MVKLLCTTPSRVAEVLATLVLIVTFSGCFFNLGNDDSDLDSLVSTMWAMEIMDVDGTLYTGAEGDFTASFTETTASGRGDCNFWSGQYASSTDGSFSLDSFTTTEIACPVGTFEDVFYDALLDINSYSINDDRLTLSSAAGDKIVFVVDN